MLTGGSRVTPTDLYTTHQAPTLLLEDLPNRAVELIAQYASTPPTPAACLLPLVCRGWRAAANRAQLLVDIHLDLAPGQQADLGTADVVALQQLAIAHEGAAAMAAAAAAGAGGGGVTSASVLRRGRQLAQWLAKHRGTVRSLCIPGFQGSKLLCLGTVRLLIRIRDALAGQQRLATPGTVLPHLVQLELPVLGLRGSAAFLQALARCPSLQRLALKQPHGSAGQEAEPATLQLLASTVSPLTQLRELCIEWTSISPYVEGTSLTALLRALPPSLEDMEMQHVECMDTIPLSCMTHLVNLRAWDTPIVDMVELDSSSSSGGGGGGRNCDASALTALTRLRLGEECLYSSDARLQLPNLRALRLQEAHPDAWEQLWGMKQLRSLTVFCFVTSQQASNDYRVGLGGMTQLEQLQLDVWDTFNFLLPPLSQPWAAAVADLTRLAVLHLPAHVLLVGGSDLLAPLMQLKELTVDCQNDLDQQYYPEGAQGRAATPPGAVLEVVTAAVAGGKGLLLQQLVLVVSAQADEWEGEEGSAWLVYDAARAALPGLIVDVEPR